MGTHMDRDLASHDGEDMYAFETMGNAICLVFEGGKPLIVTDPWLLGTAYFGSWAHHHPLSDAQVLDCLTAPFVFFSHGHPDHLHPESVSLLSRDVTVLLGDHYHSGIYDYFISQGFQNVRICRDKVWVSLSPGVRILPIANMNQDTILLIEVGDTLIINQNDSPLMGEGAFLKRIIRRYRNSYLLALCTNNADMINFVDEDGRLLIGPPHIRKKGTIVAMSKRCKYLGVQNFCCFSSQYIYVRSDSAWANPYHIEWMDMQQHWPAEAARLIEPHVTVSLKTGSVTRNHPSQAPDLSQVTNGTGEDDWSDKLTTEDWHAVERYILKYETLRSKMDFIEFVVGGDSRRILLKSGKRYLPHHKHRGVVFYAPRQSLMKTVRGGFFDDLLIGNFMKARLVNMALYPHFSPRVAKWGDNARVYSTAQLLILRWRYLMRSPSAMVRFMVGNCWDYYALPLLKASLVKLGLFRIVKQLYLGKAN